MAAMFLLVWIASVCAPTYGASLKYEPENFHISAPINTPKQMYAPKLSFKPDDHMYLFSSDGRKSPYSFVNDTGTLVGFDVDLVNKVCEMAGKRCASILAPFTECIYTYKDIDYAGPGLSAKHFDACPGYSITPDRQNEFDFTLPYLETSCSFTVAPGNPSGFDPKISDYSAFTLLRLTGAPTNGACLTRLDKKFGKFLIAPDLPIAKEMILNGTADVLFSPRNLIPGLATFDARVHCDAFGAGIMLRKGSDLVSWWNPAFKTFYLSGHYNELCTEAEAKYGRPVKCLPGPTKASRELLQRMLTPEPTVAPERLWKFVVSGQIPPFSYLNKEGHTVGWTKDFIQEVCRRAGKNCVLMLAPVSECTYIQRETQFPGRGLMEDWFDACTGYFNTPERSNSWDFTQPYLLSNASFYVKPGNPSKFNPALTDYSAFVLVRATTSITNDHCLNRLHKKFGTILTVANREEAIKCVLNGTADAWFTKRTDETQVEQLPQRFHCENVGTSVMVKKGSELPSWWDTAFTEFYQSGAFNRFCDERGRFYNYFFPCVPAPDQVNSL